MDKKRISLLTEQFDLITHQKDDVEYWLARELQRQLGYLRWENFEAAILRAIDSVKSTGVNPEDHFREVTKMVRLGSGSKRSVKD